MRSGEWKVEVGSGMSAACEVGDPGSWSESAGFVAGQSPAMQALVAELEQLARSSCTVLLQGETGTGKGLVARMLHARSPRRTEPFVHVDCASLASGLIESALFGHERGAFTGASREHRGFFERVRGGTLLLDEIGELPPDQQAKLLRVLEDRRFERVGGERTLCFRGRVVAATHCDLREASCEGRFRTDLYYRLAVAPLCVPPLRERSADIPALLAAGRARLLARGELEVPDFDPRALARLRGHAWPGNVRELLNLQERLTVTGGGARVSLERLDAVLGSGPARDRVSPLLVAASQPARPDSLAVLLGECGGNLTAAARRAGLARSTFRYRLARERARLEADQLELPGLDA